MYPHTCDIHQYGVALYDRDGVNDPKKVAVFVELLRQCLVMPFNVEPYTHRFLVTKYIVWAATIAFPKSQHKAFKRQYPEAIRSVISAIAEERDTMHYAALSLKIAGVRAVFKCGSLSLPLLRNGRDVIDQ